MAEQPTQTAPDQTAPPPPGDQNADAAAGAAATAEAPAAAPAPAPKQEEKYQHAERVKKYVACAADPVRPDKPAGDVVRYDEEFEQLQAQMDRITSLTGEQTDWRQVVELSSSILQSKSKDLLVMTYLGVGLFEQEGYKGLAAALDGYTQFLKKFWDDCFPKVKPPHGRLNAVSYLLDKLQPQIELKGPQAKRHPTADEKEAVHACSDFMEEFASACDEKFAGMGDSPNTGPVSRALKALKQKVGPIGAEAEAAAAAEAARKAAASRPAAAAAGDAAPAAGGGGFDAGPATFNTATQAVDQVKKIARYLLSQDNKDARGYRLSRLALLGNLAEPKDRLIPGIPKPTRAAMENQAASGDWQNLLGAAEAQFLITPLWLDLQRYVATALNGMGPMYEAAKKAVVFETIALQDRLPAVFDLSFKDGEPFADGATKGWLAEARKEFGAGGGGGGDDRLSTAVSEARKEQKPEDAVARLRREVDGSAGRRDQFRARLVLAQFCMDFKKLGVAQSIYQGLEEEIRAFNLNEWEPALAADALRGLYACLSANKAKPTPEEMVYRSAVFGRLCCLDPSAAFKLDGAAAPAPAPPPAGAAAARAGA